MEQLEARDLLSTLEAQLYQASLSIASITDVSLVTAYGEPALIFFTDNQKRVIYYNGRQFEFGSKRVTHARQLVELIIKDLMKDVVSTKFANVFGTCPDWVDVFKEETTHA